MAVHGHTVGAVRQPIAVALPSHAAPWLKWGGMIGLVQLFAVLTVGPLGVSTAYPQILGAIAGALLPGFSQQPYLKEVGGIGWEAMLVLGIPVGAVLSWAMGRAMGQEAGETSVAPVNVRGFEGGAARRYARGFIGGFLFIVGARLAGGCTTGHILSGTSQMAISALVFGAAVFAAGYVVARMLLREPSAS